MYRKGREENLETLACFALQKKSTAQMKKIANPRNPR
jgi:hypothetical protein